MSVRLRAIFNSPQTELMPAGVLPIHAQMAERAGFTSFQISGGMVAWWLNGEPDLRLMTRTEIIDNARRVVNSCNIPIYADADTGYGGILNIRKTVHEFIRAGVAGIHIEDQTDPKKGGELAGMSLVSDEEAIGRLNAACQARDELDPDFVIAARTDGYGAVGGGFEEALRRGKLYREKTNVDVIFFTGVADWEHARQLHAAVDGPTYSVASRRAGHAPPIAELSKMGQAINFVPFAMAGVSEVWKLLLKIKETGEPSTIDHYLDGCFENPGSLEYIGYGDAFVNPSYAKVREWEKQVLLG